MRLPLWSGLTGEQRGAYLHKVVERLEEKKEHFAQTITKEMGKSIHNASYRMGTSLLSLSGMRKRHAVSMGISSLHLHQIKEFLLQSSQLGLLGLLRRGIFRYQWLQEN